MATPAQIEEQVQLEREQIRQGLEQFRSNTKKLDDKSYASASVYGSTSIDTLLPLIVERLQLQLLGKCEIYVATDDTD